MNPCSSNLENLRWVRLMLRPCHLGSIPSVVKVNNGEASYMIFIIVEDDIDDWDNMRSPGKPYFNCKAVSRPNREVESGFWFHKTSNGFTSTKGFKF